MLEGAAVRVAIDLLQIPSRVRMVRQTPLPEGMGLLLRVAACDNGAIAEAAAITGRSEPLIAEAAAFFVEQILLAPEADSYRVLGGMAASPSTDLRRNMALLVRWMHPDVAKGADRSKFVSRVTYAWDDVKTPERREAYDMGRTQKQKPWSGTKTTGSKERRTAPRTADPGARSIERYQVQKLGLVRRILVRLFRREN
jgi:hypothetical protein